MPSHASQITRARYVGLAVFGLTLAAALATTACAPMHTPSPMSASSGYAHGAWFPVTPQATGVRLELPKPPTLTTERGRMPDGGQTTTTHGVAATTSILFQFFVTEFEAGVDGNPAAALDDLVDEFIDASDGAEIRSSGPVDMQGFPGTELVLYRYDDDVVVRVRQWMGRSRAYIFTAATPTRDEASSRASIERFFQSISLEPRDAPGPAGNGVLDLDAWQTIFPPSDEFAVQVPGAPSAAPLLVTLAGKEAEGHSYRVARADQRARFSVEVLEFAERPPVAAIDEIVTRMASHGLTLRESHDSERQGYPARAVSLRSATDVVYVVFVLTQARLYAVSLTVPVAEEASFVAHRQRFFRSLRIL